MTSEKTEQAWRALEDHAAALGPVHMRDLFAAEADRFDRLAIDVCGILLDSSKNIVTDETLGLLAGLARAADVEGWRDRMFAGEKINITEDRAVLHTALRAPSGTPVMVDGEDVMPLIETVRARMAALAEGVRAGTYLGATGKRITDVVVFGVGGSHLGPELADKALANYATSDIKVHFVPGIDMTFLGGLQRSLSWETTLFIVSSKTFTTTETLLNAQTARAWFLDRGGDVDGIGRHFVAVTSEPARARDFGIVESNIFEFWDWVGGRYSVWSAIGLPIAIAIGMKNFEAFLEGAYEMDRHFRETPLEHNMPVRMALLGIWYINIHGVRDQAVIPYTGRLSRFPDYLQQLDMESNGKSVTLSGAPVTRATAPVLWGLAGTDAQHSFFQRLHQGPDYVPVDFIAPASPDVGEDVANRVLLANCFAHTEVLMAGRTEDEVRAEMQAAGANADDIEKLAPHQVFPGNRPTNTLVLGTLDPKTLGALIALYEHKVFVQGVIWEIDSFDQWGVERGKILARDIETRLAGDAPTEFGSSSTTGLIKAVTGKSS